MEGSAEAVRRDHDGVVNAHHHDDHDLSNYRGGVDNAQHHDHHANGDTDDHHDNLAFSNYHDGVDTDHQCHTINLYDREVLGGHDNGFSFDA